MPKSGDSEAISGPQWTLLDLDGLEDAYWEHVAPVLRAEGRDPESDRPSYQWLSDHGFRGLTYTLAEHHDRSLGEFWKDDLGLHTQGFDWGIGHEPTTDALERYLDRQQQRLSWSESTVDTHRYRLARYVRAYEGVNGSADLLSPVARDSDVPASEAVDACWDTFDALDRSVDRTTLRRIYRSTSKFYSTLVSRREAAINPTDGLEYDWSDGSESSATNVPLEPQHVRALFEAAESIRDRLLVVALCAWGLRSGEVASLHRDQLVLDGDPPYVRFDERKNGPGTVAMIYGESVARERLSELVDDSSWSGFMFPSERSSNGHRARGTISNWFTSLADDAGLPDRIQGRNPVPQMARRFWYDRYSETVEELVEHQISEIAEEQGSASGEVVWQDYLSEDRRRDLRRRFMRQKLGDAFPDI